jgi:hypothetical protein
LPTASKLVTRISDPSFAHGIYGWMARWITCMLLRSAGEHLTPRPPPAGDRRPTLVLSSPSPKSQVTRAYRTRLSSPCSRIYSESQD